MPFIRHFETSHILIILIIFWSMWLYTEVSEYIERQTFNTRVEAFMRTGDRFTFEDGQFLKKRIKKLEDEIEVLKKSEDH